MGMGCCLICQCLCRPKAPAAILACLNPLPAQRCDNGTTWQCCVGDTKSAPLLCSLLSSLEAVQAASDRRPPPRPLRSNPLPRSPFFCSCQNPLLCSCPNAWCSARTKRIAGLKNLDIYALALYVDPAAAHSVLQPKLKGVAAQGLARDQTLFDGEVGGRANDGHW